MLDERLRTLQLEKEKREREFKIELILPSNGRELDIDRQRGFPICNGHHSRLIVICDPKVHNIYDPESKAALIEEVKRKVFSSDYPW